jgi:hypothetical protein
MSILRDFSNYLKFLRLEWKAYWLERKLMKLNKYSDRLFIEVKQGKDVSKGVRKVLRECDRIVKEVEKAQNQIAELRLTRRKGDVKKAC